MNALQDLLPERLFPVLSMSLGRHGLPNLYACGFRFWDFLKVLLKVPIPLPWHSFVHILTINKTHKCYLLHSHLILKTVSFFCHSVFI